MLGKFVTQKYALTEKGDVKLDIEIAWDRIHTKITN